uniref:Uncharacterized protein n=1 Tax=Fagus sylvatica TaxID=28930 RepID=A0A2N9J6M5_FAGSY
MGIMNNFINDIFEKLAQESSRLPHSSRPQSPSHFLFYFIAGEGRSRRAPPPDLPPPRKGSK